MGSELGILYGTYLAGGRVLRDGSSRGTLSFKNELEWVELGTPLSDL